MKPELLRNIFLVIFIASTLFLVSFFGRAGGTMPPATVPTRFPPETETPETIGTAEPGESSSSSHEPSGNISTSAMLGSLITSVTSLVGFITTTVITWRKEKRESSLADMERRKLETELEKSKLELEELKKKSEKKEVKTKTSKK